MSDTTLRYLIAAVIVMLLVFQIGSLIAGLFGVAWGGVSAVVVAAVSFFSARLARAGGKNSFWFLLPTLIFTVIPVVYMVWQAFTAETSSMGFASLIPFVVGFGAPILILLVVYFELRKRTLGSATRTD